MATSPRGTWEPVSAAVPFAIHPQFYLTSWFAGLCAFGLVAGWAGLHRYRSVC